mmetsp:Transcript_50134/g.92545  ORF Transcript_50134/g.92545 Transcript_50134/m.92545 type:complete len:681 (-) Transcript_50134:152-2194(-)
MACASEQPLYQVDRADVPFGVILELAGLNIKDAYERMLHDSKYNREVVAQFLGRIGFMESHPLWKKGYASLGAEEQQQYCTALSSYAHELRTAGAVQDAPTADALLTDSALRDRYAKSFVVLKYIEAWGARYWQSWAKETRGNVLWVNPETNEVKIMGFKLPRGAEVLTGMHARSDDADTQDIKGHNYNILDAEQQDTCKKLIGLQAVSGDLSSKGDGSLLVITTYTGLALRIMIAAVETFGSEQAKLWMQMSLRLSSNEVLVIASTQGTLWLDTFMAEYMVTAMLAGTGVCSREQLEDHLARGLNALSIWQEYGSEVISMILGMVRFDLLSATHCFCFEAICKDRRGVGETRRHTELACSYNRDRLVFLGLSVCEARFYIPHSAYGRKCEIPFEEPLWWRIEDGKQIQDMMEDMEQMIFNTMSKAAYLEKWQPSNPCFDQTDEKQVQDAILDFEGWVFMKEAALTVEDADHLAAREGTGCEVMIYSKVKTEAYYLAHKFNERKIARLTELARAGAGHIFPLAAKVADWFEGGETAARLVVVMRQVNAAFDFSESSELMTEARAAFQRQLANAERAVAAGDKKVKVPKDPFKGFDFRPVAVQWKMIMGLPALSDYVGEQLLPIFKEAFPQMDEEKDGLAIGLKSILIDLEVWEQENLEERVSRLRPDTASMQVLAGACLS